MIPVNFSNFSGHLCQVAGAGETAVFYLYNDKNYYFGRLRTYNSKWVFDENKASVGFSALADRIASFLPER